MKPQRNFLYILFSALVILGILVSTLPGNVSAATPTFTTTSVSTPKPGCRGAEVKAGTQIVTVKDDGKGNYGFVSTRPAKSGEFRMGGLGIWAQPTQNGQYGVYGIACDVVNYKKWDITNPVQLIVYE